MPKFQYEYTVNIGISKSQKIDLSNITTKTVTCCVIIDNCNCNCNKTNTRPSGAVCFIHNTHPPGRQIAAVDYPFLFLIHTPQQYYYRV